MTGTLDRQVPNSSTVGAVTGDSFMDEVSIEVGGLWDRSFITLGSVAGTADVITASVTPSLVGALVDGMKFTLPTGSGANTTAATLNIDGTARAIVRQDGSATQAGDLPANSRVPLEYDLANTRFVMMHPPRAAQGADLDYQSFTASGTWTKPVGISNNALVLVELWGGGGAGGANGGYGGGGGGYSKAYFRASQLASTVTVTIGAGGTGTGTNGNVGGNTTFGSLLTAYGGGGGANGLAGSGGGGGGGQTAAGGSAAASVGGNGGGPLGGANGNPGGDSTFGGAGGCSGSSATGGSSYYGGAGGGFLGGSSIYGGGGGGAGGGAGTSKFGGNGGGSGAAGTAPAGGGGSGTSTGSNGARGECRVLVIG